MSLAETQQIFNLLTQIDSLLSNIETKTQTIPNKLQKVATQTVMIQQALTRTITLLRRMGMPEHLDAAAQKVLRFISLMNQARLAAIALSAALAGTPGGLLMLTLAGLGLIMDTGDLMMSN